MIDKMGVEDLEEQTGKVDAILHKMFSSRGFDFRDYKMSSLQRRISRRMDILEISSLAEYSEYLEANPDEYKALFTAILVSTTQFFRDMEAWTFVRENVLPEITERCDEIRIWSAGCASGEEPYSVAMFLADMLGDDLLKRPVKIYATDLDEASLKFARSGTYTLDQLAVVSEDMRNKYFVRRGDVYTIARDIRDLLIFSRHNLMSDPPIPRIDLLLCRNVLIYFNRELQLRIIPKLQYALNDNGYLWLGRAETLVADVHSLKPLNTKWRIFMKVPSPPQAQMESAEQADGYTKAELILANKRLEQITQNIRLGFIMLDEDFRVVICSKTIQEIWNLVPDQILGKSFFDLEISYRPVELKHRIEQVVATRGPSVVEDAEYWITKDKRIYLKMEIVPITPGVIIFAEDVTKQYESKRELQIANKSLETLNEKLLSANEELKNENRGLQSINEELQCTNEEVESANAELKATNEELRARIAELDTLNRYMKWL